MNEMNNIEELASRSDRLAAVIVDSVILISISVLIIYLKYGFDDIINTLQNLSLLDTIVLFIFGQTSFLILNGYLLLKKGQTIGKKFMEIKIVTTDDELPSLLKSYVLRYLSISLFAYVPIIGNLLIMIDDLFIFRNDRRCIHDLVAGTKVVEA